MKQVISIAKYDDREMQEWTWRMRTPSPKALRWFLIEQIVCLIAGIL
jgi:hypothetical protein